jgi:hypothetical protein
MEAHDRTPITDSPWFWVMIFSLMALGALMAIGGKYGRRQSTIERQYQARERIAHQQAASNNSASAERNTVQESLPRGYASPGDPLIPLWPLAALLVAVALIALVMLCRGRGRPGSLSGGQLS